MNAHLAKSGDCLEVAVYSTKDESKNEEDFKLWYDLINEFEKKQARNDQESKKKGPENLEITQRISLTFYKKLITFGYSYFIIDLKSNILYFISVNFSTF